MCRNVDSLFIIYQNIVSGLVVCPKIAEDKLTAFLQIIKALERAKNVRTKVAIPESDNVQLQVASNLSVLCHSHASLWHRQNGLTTKVFHSGLPAVLSTPKMHWGIFSAMFQPIKHENAMQIVMFLGEIKGHNDIQRYICFCTPEIFFSSWCVRR